MTIELGTQPTIQAAKDAFVDALIDQGEEYIDGPVWRVAGEQGSNEWADFHATTCCGYEDARATVERRPIELAATFGH